MDTASVVKRGIIAGLIIISSAATMVPVVGNEMDTALAKFGLPPLSIGDMIYFFLVSLLIGMILMWLYATLLPIYQKRFKTIAICVLIIWLPGYLLPNWANVVYGFMPVKLTIIGIIWGLGELLAAGIIASRLAFNKAERKQ